MTDKVLSTPAHVEPVVFTRDQLDWLPWLEPMAEQDLTARHMAGLVDAARAKSAYFMLLARDPDILGARTRTDKDIFYNPNGGLPRAERELATVAVSYINGCAYCASVHARRFAELTKQPEVIQRLFNEGLDTELDPRRRAIVDYAAKLTRAPQRMTSADLAPLRAVGMTDLEILDLTHAAAMFAWANRLMQTLGEPVAPAKQ